MWQVSQYEHTMSVKEREKVRKCSVKERERGGGHLKTRKRKLQPWYAPNCLFRDGLSLRMSKASFISVSLSFLSLLSTVKWCDLGSDPRQSRHWARWVKIADFLEGSKCCPIRTNHCAVVIPMYDVPSSRGQVYLYTRFDSNRAGIRLFSPK